MDATYARLLAYVPAGLEAEFMDRLAAAPAHPLQGWASSPWMAAQLLRHKGDYRVVEPLAGMAAKTVRVEPVTPFARFIDVLPLSWAVSPREYRTSLI